jgi:hypothetical protein
MPSDTRGPFDHHVVRGACEFVEQQALDLSWRSQSVGIHVEELAARTLVYIEQGKGRTGDVTLHAKPTGKSAYQRGLARAKVALEEQRNPFWQQLGEFLSSRLGLRG